MPAYWGVNPLATSHTVEHLSGMCMHSRSHDNPILYLIYHCLNKKMLETSKKKTVFFLVMHKK